MENCKVSLGEDDYIRELQDTGRTAIWVATLSCPAYLGSNLKVYQDDDRPGREPHSAWIRLGNFVRENGLTITRLDLKFRDRWVNIGENAEGYYCVKQAFCGLGGPTTSFYILGCVKDGILSVQQWQIPELTLASQEEREIKEGDPCLILNPQLTVQK